MAAPAVWLSRPVFVTSTFRDTHAERDWLRARVLPELEERLRVRRCHLEPIDLRWGVETTDAREEEAKQLLVLKVCLGEVERSRPFLIGILGDRYGWVPPSERMAAAAAEAGFERPVAGRSVTELEIDFGVLSDPEQRRRCFFYFREPLPYDEMPPELAAQYREVPGSEPAERLAALKGRIERELPDRVRHYSVAWDSETQSVGGLEAWGQQVLDDLWRELDAETIDRIRTGEPSWEEAERWTLEQFVEERARNFVGRTAILDDLLSRTLARGAAESPWGVCLTASAGAGKSAVFAELYRRLAGEEVLVLAHAAGISPRSTQVDAMLRRWVAELAAAQGEENPLGAGAGAEEVEAAFGSLLGRTSTERRVVLLLDALNQFEPTPRAQHLTWLPKLWPPNARLVATAIPGAASEALAARPAVDPMALPPLDADESAEIARALCARYHRTLNPRVLSALLEKRAPDGSPAAGNPLWLALAVEELNLLDADDFARMEREFTGTSEERLFALLLAVSEAMPAGVAKLYGWLLERAEELHGRGLVQALVNLIAMGRAGWRESDFRALVPELSGRVWDDLEFAALRRTLRAHVVQRGAQAQWDFSHAQLRESVIQRNLVDPGAMCGLHRRIAEHLEELPAADPLHESETMVHWIGAGERPRAAQYYGSELTEGEALGATQALAATIIAGAATDPNPGLAWSASLLGESEHSPQVRGRLCNRFNFELHDALLNEGTLATRAGLLESARAALERLAAADPTNALWLRGLSVSHARTGDVRTEQGDLAGALESYQAALAIAEHLTAVDPGNAAWQRDLSASHNNIGDVRTAQGDLAGALEVYQVALAIRERLAAADPGNAEWQSDVSASHERIGNVCTAQGDLAGALEVYQAALAIRGRLAAVDPENAAWQRDFSLSHNNVGDVRTAQGDLAGALEASQAALAIRERLVAADPGNAGWQLDLSVSHERIGSLRTAQGDLAGALEASQAALAIRERFAATDPGNAKWQNHVSVGHNNVGDVRRAQGDLAGALKSYQAARVIDGRLAAADPTNATWQRCLSVCHGRIGDVRRAQGDLAGALEAYQTSLAIRERLAATDPGNVEWLSDLSASHDNIGDVRTAQGDLAGALEVYQVALAIRERLAAADPGNAAWQRGLSVSHDRIGSVHSAQGDLAGALKADRAALAVAERLVAADPTNTPSQADLSVSHIKVGDVCKARGDLVGALEAYQAALAIAECLAAADPRNASWQRGLSVSHARIGAVRAAHGDLAGALDVYQDALAIGERLAAADPGNAEWQRDLSVSHIKLGGVRRAQGDLAGALEVYQAALAIGERLAAADPTNARSQDDLSASHEGIGNVRMAQGDFAGALEAYQASLAIRERLAAEDQRNAAWQSELSVSHARIGDVRTEQGDFAGALKAYQAALAIQKRLAAADPTDTRWQRDLSVCHGRIGDVRTEQGDFAGALEAYQADLAIAERLAATDPRNADWQRDLSVSYARIGDVRTAQGDLAGALDVYQTALAIGKRLTAADRRNAAWQRDLLVRHIKVGDLRKAQGDLAGALEAYQAALAIAERLTAVDPGNAAWQRDLSVSHNKIGDVRTAQGDLAGALEAYQTALAIAERLAATDARNAEWQRDLVVSFTKLATSFQEREPEAAQAYWRRCHEKLRAMRDAGIHLDPSLRDLLLRLESSRDSGIEGVTPDPAMNQLKPEGSKPMEVATAYKEFLDKEGYRATVSDSGIIQFKKEGGSYAIIPDESDPEFFRLLYPRIWSLASDAERQHAYVAAHEVGAIIKAAKIVVQDDSVYAAVESLLPELAAFPRIFERAADICKTAAEKFGETMRSAAAGGG